MAGVTNGLILCLLSVLATPSVYPARVQNSQIGPLLTIPQSPTHFFALKHTTLFLPCGISTTAEILESWWLKNGIRLDLEDSNNIRQTGLDLTFVKLDEQPDASHSDSGIYRCAIKLQAGVVLGPNRIISIAALDINNCSNSSFEGILTQSVVLSCCVKSIPYGNVTWNKQGSAETNSRHQILKSGDLLILNLTKEDSGSYSCIVQNEHFKNLKEAAVKLVVRDDPETEIGPYILDTFGSDLILTTEPINLHCAANGVPRPSTSWLITFESNNKIQTLPVPLSSISLSSLNVTGNYTCIASSGVKQVVKSVMVRPFPSFPNPSTLTNPQAKTIRFECRSPLSSITWFKDGEPLDTNQGRVKHRNGELIISNTILSDGGFYQCESENYIGTGRLILDPPKERLDAPVSLNCTSISPTQILVKWDSPSGRIVQAFSVHYTPTDRGEERQRVTNNTPLLIETLVPSTNYSIYVRSYSGKSASSQSEYVYCTTLEDTPIAVPQLLLGKQLGPPTQFRLQWRKLTKAQSRGTVQHYKLQWRVSDGSFSNVQILRGDSDEFIISGLLPSTHYSLRLLPATSVGYPLGKDALPWTSFETKNSSAIYRSPELKVTALNATTIATSWQYEFNPISSAEDDDASGFRLLLGEFDDKMDEIIYQPIIYLSSSDREYIFPGLALGTQYHVILQAFTETWESSLAVKNVRTEVGDDGSNATNTAVVEILEANPISSTEISLNWSRPFTSEVGHYVLRFKAVDSRDVSLLNSTNESLIVKDLRPFASYEFDVAFQVNGICGPFSQKVETKTLEGVPSPPLLPQFLVLNKTSIKITWKAPANPNGIIKGYYVELRDGSTKGPSEFSTVETQLTLGQLQQNKFYEIRIAGETTGGRGEFSASLHPKIFSTNTSKVGENGEMIQDKPENNTTIGSPESSQQQLGLILGIGLGLVCIVICSLIVIWRNTCFSYLVSGGRRRPRTATFMNGVVEKDTVDSPGTEMVALRAKRNSQSYLDTKGGHPTIINCGSASATDPLLRLNRNPEVGAEEFDRGLGGGGELVEQRKD